jgi:hypothetical protein
VPHWVGLATPVTLGLLLPSRAARNVMRLVDWLYPVWTRRLAVGTMDSTNWLPTCASLVLSCCSTRCTVFVASGGPLSGDVFCDLPHVESQVVGPLVPFNVFLIGDWFFMCTISVCDDFRFILVLFVIMGFPYNLTTIRNINLSLSVPLLF